MGIGWWGCRGEEPREEVLEELVEEFQGGVDDLAEGVVEGGACHGGGCTLDFVDGEC